MAREVLTVCLPPTDPGTVRRAIAEAIAPFDHNAEGEDLEPGEWDVWSLGAAGREFWIRPGAEGDPRLIREYEPTREGQVHVIAPDRCSGGPVGALDIQTQRSRAAAEADVLWHAWEELSAGFPPARSLEDLIAEEPGASDRRPGPAWHRYAAQPLMRAVLEDPVLHARFGQRAVGDFGVGHERFLRRKYLESLARDALLTLDRMWISPVSLPHEEYIEFFNTYIDELSPNAVVVNITYHS
ncbi:hypothetical protein [Streptomyces sp. Tu102]|uniref:hypothetical protein n=1 Tax=Streptomyces sp. Tu102 TaxID=2838019 RepID=UPI001BDCB986|nr:hypothetical protein [Streptomyces sp. Tu102]MBT1091910.1 hypothetical protein [Streptomyces sp. Tu102]